MRRLVEILPKALTFTGLFVATGFVCAAGARAQEPPAEAQRTGEACIAIETAAERLACYDRAFGRDRLPGDRPPESAPDPKLAAHPPGGGPPELFDGGDDDPPVNDSLLDSRWELSRRAKLGTWTIRGYKPIYVLPWYWDDSPNTTPSSPAPGHTVDRPEILDDGEVKFQVSFKTKVWEGILGHRGDLWFGYTQSSRWQLYNAKTSRHFRESDYEPEMMLVFNTRYRLLGLDGRLAGVSLNHQSNGRDNPLSRSWNRVIGLVGLEREGWTLMIRPWLRIPDPDGDDDNPDIEDYVGRGDLQLVRRLSGHELSLLARHSLRGGERSHGALAFEWAFPIQRNLRGHLEVFHGYGESLIDYNDRSTRIGLGISLLEWY